MDWLENMNSAIDYIETHLADEINAAQVAKAACSSEYHFQRMFSFITTVSLAEYIRRRRLTLAAFELQSTDKKVIDIAIKYGYDSQSSFTRAFQLLHGVTPTTVRSAGVFIKAYPRISFQIMIQGVLEMNYKIENKNEFSLFGKSITLTSDQDKFEILPLFGDQIMEDGTHDKINSMAGNPPGTLLSGVHFGFNVDTGVSQYMFAADLPTELLCDEFTTLDVPALTWVVFADESMNPLAILNIWKRVYTEWFPTSEYVQTDGPCIEKYLWLDETHLSHRCELWIPITLRNQLITY